MSQSYYNLPCVYYIHDNAGNCKIGVASEITKRLSVLQVGNANELSVVNIEYFDSIDEAYEREKEVHADLVKYKKRGEWYDNDAVLRYLESGKEEQQGASGNIIGLLQAIIDLGESKSIPDMKEKAARWDEETKEIVFGSMMKGTLPFGLSKKYVMK